MMFNVTVPVVVAILCLPRALLLDAQDAQDAAVVGNDTKLLMAMGKTAPVVGVVTPFLKLTKESLKKEEALKCAADKQKCHLQAVARAVLGAAYSVASILNDMWNAFRTYYCSLCKSE